MASIERPNRQALSSALDIYRDEMRTFIFRCLNSVRGRTTEDCIKSALRDDQYNQFQRNRTEGNSVESSIDIGDFPQIVKANWRDTFENTFKTGNGVQQTMRNIITARNVASHPETQDIQLDDAVQSLNGIANILTEINRPEQSSEVLAMRDNILPFKTHAHHFRQGGREVYAFSLELIKLDKLLPDRVDDRIVRDANRPLTPKHARDIQKYLEDRSDWLLGALLLGISPDAVEFQPYTDDTDTNVGALSISNDGAASMKMFDGQHRRRAIKDLLSELSHNKRNSKKLISLKEASLPVMLYVEDDIDALRQMFADAAQTRTIERNTITRFDQRDAFNLAALWIEENSDLFSERVEMERASVARGSPNIIAINQLAMTLKTLEVGYTGRVSKERNEEYMLDLDSLYERCLEWADDFMPAARDEYNDLMAGEVDNSEIPQQRAETMAYNATVIRILAACCHEWMRDGMDWQPLADFLQEASLRPGVSEGSLLIDAGVVAPGGITPNAQRQIVVKAVDYIVQRANE